METTTAAPRHSHQQLRRAFIEQARKYIGVPYSKSACRPEHKDATFYLDCCGLVRQVLRDLEPMFGFTIGQGNQAYQYDTLPVTLNSTEEMLPGDLIFYTGTYHNPASCQAHNVVHVEIYTGVGRSTIGSRHGQVVSEHSEFEFEGHKSERYHSVEYVFKSISTWLDGVCRSFCPEHSWDAQCRRMLKLYRWAKDTHGMQEHRKKPKEPTIHKPPRTTKKNKKKTNKKRLKLATEVASVFEGHNRCNFATTKKDDEGRYIPCNNATALPNSLFCHEHFKWQTALDQCLELPKASMEIKVLRDLAIRKRSSTKSLIHSVSRIKIE